MKLIEVFNQLTFGELSQIHIGGNTGPEGEINEDNYRAIMVHINLGLAALYKRFNLKENQLVLALQAGQSTYPLYSKFAVNNTKSTELVRYILDTPAAPFVDDIIKIERVLTPDGEEMGINIEKDMYACATPSMMVLRVPPVMIDGSTGLPDYLKDVAELTVVYRAKHPIMDPDVGSFDPTRLEVELPYSHLQALCLFVASRVNNPIGMTNEFHAGNSYAAKYEQECQLLEGEGIQVDQGSGTNRLQDKGFV